MILKIKKIILYVLRLLFLILLAYIIYRLYLYHMSGYEMLLCHGKTGYRLLISCTPMMYRTEDVTFFRSVSVLILVVPAVFAYMFVSMLIGDCIRKINMNPLSEKKVYRAMKNATLADIVQDNGKTCGGVDFRKNSENYMSNGIVGRRALEAKHAAAPDIYENNSDTNDESDSE